MFQDDIFLEDVSEATLMTMMPKEVVANIRLRAVEAVESIYNGRGLLSAPVAGIYRLEYSDGSNNEVLVMGAPNKRNFETARFLEKGRSSDQLSQVIKLIIRTTKGDVPETIKAHLCAYETERDQSQRLYA